MDAVGKLKHTMAHSWLKARLTGAVVTDVVLEEPGFDPVFALTVRCQNGQSFYLELDHQAAYQLGLWGSTGRGGPAEGEGQELPNAKR